MWVSGNPVLVIARRRPGRRIQYIPHFVGFLQTNYRPEGLRIKIHPRYIPLFIGEEEPPICTCAIKFALGVATELHDLDQGNDRCMVQNSQ